MPVYDTTMMRVWRRCLSYSLRSVLPIETTSIHVEHILCCNNLPLRNYHKSDRSNFSLGRLNLVKPLHLQIEEHKDQIALIDQHGRHSFEDIIISSNKLTDKLSDVLGGEYEKTKGKRVGILCDNDLSFVLSQLSVWKTGAICVPLCKSHPVKEIQFFLEDSEAECVITDTKHANIVSELAAKLNMHHVILEKADMITESKNKDPFKKTLVNVDGCDEKWSSRVNRDREFVHRNLFRDQAALIIYTSGTTGRPKGVLHSHGSLAVQVLGQVEAWRWSAHDVLLHVLPLHHIHGIVNTLHVPLHVGASCLMLPKFDAAEVWSRLVDAPAQGCPPVTLFMAVPTIYAKLIQHMEEHHPNPRTREFIRQSCASKIRLMVSGSASLPEPVMSQWHELTGHTLLERYGMSELGMVLTNPLHGNRISGSVGNPFPGVSVRIVEAHSGSPSRYSVLAEGDEQRTKLVEGADEVEGELQTKGLNTFTEYWRQPDATRESFTKDGWFKTGDIASYKQGAYRILGRSSVDIIKSGGYKMSGLSIEHHLLAHPDIAEIAVVGIPDITWGQKVAAVIVLKDGASKLDLKAIRDWGARLMPYYQLPVVLKVVDEIPKNAMGKVNKKELLVELFAKEMKMVM